MRYDMTDFAQACVEAYVGLAGGDVGLLRKVPSPYLSEADPDPKGELSKGRLAPIAAKILMQILYTARVVRFDRRKSDTTSCYHAVIVQQLHYDVDK